MALMDEKVHGKDAEGNTRKIHLEETSSFAAAVSYETLVAPETEYHIGA